jgi:hypothetical protein
MNSAIRGGEIWPFKTTTQPPSWDGTQHTPTAEHSDGEKESQQR